MGMRRRERGSFLSLVPLSVGCEAFYTMCINILFIWWINVPVMFSWKIVRLLWQTKSSNNSPLFLCVRFYWWWTIDRGKVDRVSVLFLFLRISFFLFHKNVFTSRATQHSRRERIPNTGLRLNFDIKIKLFFSRVQITSPSTSERLRFYFLLLRNNFIRFKMDYVAEKVVNRLPMSIDVNLA